MSPRRFATRLVRALRRRLGRLIPGRNDDLAARTEALERRVERLTGLVDEALGTAGRTGRALDQLERSIAPEARSVRGVGGPRGPAAVGSLGATADTTAARVSVVIPTYNRVDSLAEVIACLRAADYPDFELVIVNGPSTDGTADYLASLGDAVKVVGCDARNIAASRNLGSAAAAGSIVAFIDDDTLPDPGWLGPLVAMLGGSDAVGAAGAVLRRTGRIQFRHIATTLLGEAAPIDDFDPSDWYASPYAPRVMYAPGGNSAYWREALIGAGGFDEVFEYGGEEGDLAVRLRDAGSAVRAADGSFVVHLELANDDRTADHVITSRYRYLRSKAYFVAKHGSTSHSRAEIETSHARTIERFRAERLRAIGRGQLTEATMAAFEDEVVRAVRDGEALWADRASRTRDAAWFGDRTAPFRPFPHRPAGPDKQHVCLVAPRPSDPGAGEADLEALAADGHVVRVVGPASGQPRIFARRGVWLHELAVPGSGGPAADASAVGDAVARIAEARPLTDLRVAAGSPADWSRTLQAAGLRPR